MTLLQYWHIGCLSILIRVRYTEDQLVMPDPQQVPSRVCTCWGFLAEF